MKIIIHYDSYDEVFYTKKNFFKWINKTTALNENIYKRINKNEFHFKNCSAFRFLGPSMCVAGISPPPKTSRSIRVSSKFGDICSFIPHRLNGPAQITKNKKTNMIVCKCYYYIEGIKIEGNDFEKAANVYKIKKVLLKKQ